MRETLAKFFGIPSTMALRSPTPFRISTYTMGGYICADLNDKDSIIPLHVFSRLLPITRDDDSETSIAAKNSLTGCYVAISDYIDNDYTDMPRGRTAEDKRVYKLPSQVFNNQISLRYKYWGFRCISYKLFSNGRLQFTGIMDPKWEPHHIANQLISVLHELKYKVAIDIAAGTKYCDSHCLDYMLVWDSDSKQVTYRRRNLEVYDFNGIMQSGIINRSGDSPWLDHTAATTLITNYFKPIEAEQIHLESIMDRMRNIPEFTIDIRHNIFETDYGLGRYRQLTMLSNQYLRLPDIEFRRLVQQTVKKILKTFANYKERLAKLLATDKAIAEYVNKKYRRRIMTKLRRIKNDSKNADASIDHKYTGLILDYPTEMTDKPYRVTDITTDLINSDFNTRYINLLSVISLLLQSHGIYNYYQPNNKYPGIIARFAYNPRYINAEDGIDRKPGKCYCKPKCVAGDKSGRGTNDSRCTFITVNIFRTGSVMITSARNIDQIHHVYKWINEFFAQYSDRVFRELPDKHDYALENEDRNIVKKTELHYIPAKLVHADTT